MALALHTDTCTHADPTNIMGDPLAHRSATGSIGLYRGAQGDAHDPVARSCLHAVPPLPPHMGHACKRAPLALRPRLGDVADELEHHPAGLRLHAVGGLLESKIWRDASCHTSSTRVSGTQAREKAM